MKWNLSSRWGPLDDASRPLIYIANRARIAGDTIGALLTIEGFRTTVGQSEAALLAALIIATPDVVVLDESIGRNFGLGVLAGLRRAYPNLPVILTASADTLGISTEALAIGARELIVKPVDAEQLLQAIIAALGQTDNEQADEDEGGVARQWRNPQTR